MYGFHLIIKKAWMKTNRVLIIVIPIVFAAVVTWFVAGQFINKNYHERIVSNRKMYCYENYWGVVNPALFVKKEQYIDSLIAYYQKIERGDSTPIFNFPPLSLPLDTCVYVLGYGHDSLITEIICYYDWGKEGSFVKGYVFSNTLHDLPPPDSLMYKR